mmetsp:Transcript_53186/g.64094  ORF Transcript_53186/g.64094 Transcript_53186/m.64094 type:complete len:593 (+) Transcript_53186:27-1805(+)
MWGDQCQSRTMHVVCGVRKAARVVTVLILLPVCLSASSNVHVLPSKTILPGCSRSPIYATPILKALKLRCGSQTRESNPIATPSISHQLIRGGSTTIPPSKIESKKTPNDDAAIDEKVISPVFPIFKSEIPQFVNMSLMMFFLIYVFTTTRDVKDALVVPHCGAESVPFLKLYGAMPSAALFILVYSKLSNILSRDKLFYATLVPFFCFYGIFGFVLFPLRDKIHFSFGGDAAVVSGGIREVALSLLNSWSFSLYFIVSELWASVSIPLLFWQCANEITKLDQAQRYYPLFAVFGNFAPILSGKIMSSIVALQETNDDTGFGLTLRILTGIKVILGMGICVFYRLVYKNSSVDTMSEAREQAPQSKEKKKQSLKESIHELSNNSELRSIATIVFCYYSCLEFTEVLWKGILRKQYPSKSTYMLFMGNFSQVVGWCAVILQILAPHIIRGVGWKGASLLVPLSMGVLAMPFFACVSLSEKLDIPIRITFLIGTAQSVINKISKYALFDPLKEMAYIPLGHDAKVKGKAAVELMGSKLGKSYGSATQQILVVVMGGTILRCAPALGMLYILGIFVWSRSVLSLGKMFEVADASS